MNEVKAKEERNKSLLRRAVKALRKKKE